VTGLTSNPTIFDRAIKDGTGAGADLVVRTLDEVSRPALAQGRLERTTEAR
jgi:hypothetical protein